MKPKTKAYAVEPLLIEPIDLYARIMQGRTIRDRYKIGQLLIHTKYIAWLTKQQAIEGMDIKIAKLSILVEDQRISKEDKDKDLMSIKYTRLQKKMLQLEADALENEMDVVASLMQQLDTTIVATELTLLEVLETLVLEAQTNIAAKAANVPFNAVNSMIQVSSSLTANTTVPDFTNTLISIIGADRATEIIGE